jgi:hypothetical protein
LGIDRPSVGVFQNYQQPLVQNAVEIDVATITNAIKEGKTTNNINQISIKSTLQSTRNMLQQSNMINGATTNVGTSSLL